MDLNVSAEAQAGQQPQQQSNDQASSSQQQSQQQQQQNQQPPYTIPGLLHYLQYEWHRFEVERQEWEVEKAELTARIALLQGEKKSHENLRHDLIRRIKMLEYCLRMERAKYQKLKHGTEPPPIECTNINPAGSQQQEEEVVGFQKMHNDDGYMNTNNSNTITYGRELLKHYLQEVGYTDTIIDLRSNRVRSLLGIVDQNQPDEDLQQPQQNSQPNQPSNINFNGNNSTNTANNSTNTANISINVANNITNAANNITQSNVPSTTSTPTATQAWCPSTPKSDVVDIGELATLTTLASDSTSDDSPKKQWTNKYRLQSHYDCVRALRFSEKDSLIVTASEDETIKLWYLTRPSSAGSKSRQPILPPSINAMNSLEASTLDIEPLHTYRGHTSRILAITTYQDFIFSGAQNGELIMWRIIPDPSTADQYDKYDSSLLLRKYAGHDDAIWSVETVDHPKSELLLCSAGADLKIKIWSISGEATEPLRTIALDSSPTCIARMPPYNVCQAGVDIAVSSCDGKIRLYDLSASLNNTESNTQPTAMLECDDSFRVNSIVIHPTLPYLASADSNRSIKFWDLKTNKCKLTMVAHLDEVTSLACDPTGKYLLSAGHDCSARLWLFEEKACIQEITSHRKKFDEGIFAVAFHPTLPHFATAGADGLAKVFV